MKETAQELLHDTKKLIEQLNNEQYKQSQPLLMGSSIGKHVRHIIDLFDCLIYGSNTLVINYDARKRNENFEKFTQAAINRIDELIEEIKNLNLDMKIRLVQELKGTTLQIPSQINRELLYNIEHTVHHLAIIRMAIQQEFPEVKIPDNLGIAFSTIQYREQSQA